MQLLAILPIKHLIMLTSTLGVAATLPSLHHHVASWNPARCLNHTSSRTDNTMADCGMVNGFTCARSAHDHDTITGQQPPSSARISSELPIWCIGSADDHTVSAGTDGTKSFMVPPRETFATGRTSVTSTLGISESIPSAGPRDCPVLKAEGFSRILCTSLGTLQGK